MTRPDNRFAKALTNYEHIQRAHPDLEPVLQPIRDVLELAARADAVGVENIIADCIDYARRDFREGAWGIAEAEIVVDVIGLLKSRHLLSARPAGITREWQPIETAPKDEIKIWGYWTNKNGPFQGTIWWDWEMENWRDEYYPFSASTITHWMPLPAPPALDAVISMMEGE